MNVAAFVEEEVKGDDECKSLESKNTKYLLRVCFIDPYFVSRI